MSGSHGCGTWKTSKKTKGYYKPLYNQDTGKYYTVTSTKKQPTHRRGTKKTWSGALQLGKNVYISGGPWFEYKGTGSGTGDDNFRVHGMNKSQTRAWLEEKGIPYNKLYWEGNDKLNVKVPGGTLWDKGWPWSSKIGYPTKWDVRYYIWTEDDPTQKEVSYGEYMNWVTYIDVHSQLDAEEVEDFMAQATAQYKQMHGGSSALRRGVEYSSRSDLAGWLSDIELFYSQRSWNLTTYEKMIVGDMWGELWTQILGDDEVFNRVWFRLHGYV